MRSATKPRLNLKISLKEGKNMHSLKASGNQRGPAQWSMRMITPIASDLGAGVIVGANVREVRQSRGWSQATLGQKAGLRQGYISAIERGERCPSLERRFDLAQAFDVAPSRLVGAPVTDAEKG
jgi:DNA-binding XRE family transcriptional regulator